MFGDVHVVFNNAGIAYAGPIAETSHDDWRFVIDVDLWGPIHGVEAFLPRLIAQQADSHIVFTSSFAGLIPNVGLGPYCVAKYGVVALAETLAREVRAQRHRGIGALPDDRGDQPDGQHRAGQERGLRPGATRTAETVQQLASAPADDSVLNVEDVARLTTEAILANRLYVVPHRAARDSIRRRFERIDRTFDDQAAEGWDALTSRAPAGSRPSAGCGTSRSRPAFPRRRGWSDR